MHKTLSIIRILFLVVIMGLAACDSAGTTPPIPIQEAIKINSDVMSALKAEVNEAFWAGKLQPGLAYINGSVSKVTGSSTSDTEKDVTHATVEMNFLQIGTDGYHITGTINYEVREYFSSERFEKYESEGTFIIERGIDEIWTFRWPLLKIDFVFTSDENIAPVRSGSYVINGVTYSYARGN